MAVNGNRRRVKRSRKKLAPGSSQWRAAFPNLKTDKPGLAPVSNTFAKTGPKKDPLEHKWKLGKEENAKTLEEIERKKGMVAIPYNKGAYQAIIPSDVKSLGKK